MRVYRQTVKFFSCSQIFRDVYYIRKIYEKWRLYPHRKNKYVQLGAANLSTDCFPESRKKKWVPGVLTN